MRILFPLSAYKPAWRIGGPVASVSASAETLAKKGHEVIVLATNSNLTEDLDVPLDRAVDVDGVEVWYFKREEPLQKFLPFVSYVSRSMGYTWAPKMKAALRRVVPGVDVVHTQMPFVYPSYAGAHAAFAAHKPLFYSQRGNFNPVHLQFRAAKKKVYINLIEKPIMRRATTLLSLTENEDRAYRMLGIATPSAIVPNGVNVPPARPDAARNVRERFGIDESAQLVLFLGRLHPVKGAEKLIDVFVHIAAQHPRAVLVMAGPDEWRLEEQWRARANELGVADRIYFPGMITGDVKADMLARADLFVLPSTGEGFSNAILEALASGTAVLISPHCNFPEVAAAGAGAIVGNDIPAITAELSRLLAQPDTLRAMGETARRFVTEHYSWDVITDRLLDVYAEGIARARRP